VRFWRVALVIMLLSAGIVSCGPVAPKYQDQVLADKPLVYWRLNEATGTVAVDASGNGLSGTYEAGVALGQAGALAGDSAAGFANLAAVLLPAAAALDVRTSVSVEAWVKPSAAGENGGIFEKTVTGVVNSQYMLMLESGVAKFRVRTAAGALVPVDGPILAVGSWSHLVGTFDGTTLRLYLNGAQVAQAAAAGPLAGGSGQSYVGHLSQRLYPFAGTLDEVAVFAAALSADRVRAHYQAAEPTPSPH